MTKVKDDKALVTIDERVQNKFMELIRSEQYPVDVKEGIDQVVNIINTERQITDLYPEVLAEIPISQSLFQDQSVQYEAHFTDHKKLRQAVLEMQDRLNALYSAKTGHKRAYLKVQRILMEIENLEEEISSCDVVKDKKSIKRLELAKADKGVDLEEAQRGLKSAAHLIKDAMIKVTHQRKMVERYEALVKESGLSYEESEFVYYVMYFTADAEKQLRTGDHQVDRGTFGVIANLPEPIRLKVLSNIDFMEKKLFGREFPKYGDYLHIVYRDMLMPKKTGPGEFEGIKVSDFLGINTIKLLSKTIEGSDE